MHNPADFYNIAWPISAFTRCTRDLQLPTDCGLSANGPSRGCMSRLSPDSPGQVS